MSTLKFIAGFIILNAYLRILPSLVAGSDILWLALFIFFFPLAHFTARWSSQSGLKEMGLAPDARWRRLFGRGLLVGSLVWLALTGAEFMAGSLQLLAWQSPDTAAWLAVQAVVVALLGSATNDVMTRGYIWAHWKDRLPPVTLVLLSTVLYIADDVWLEGWSMRNNLFSLILGLAFTLSLLRTRSLWMNIGIHTGLNLIYYLVYGFGSGETNLGLFTSISRPTEASSYFGLYAAGAILVLTLWHRRKREPGPKRTIQEIPQPAQLQEQD